MCITGTRAVLDYRRDTQMIIRQTATTTQNAHPQPQSPHHEPTMRRRKAVFYCL